MTATPVLAAAVACAVVAMAYRWPSKTERLEPAKWIHLIEKVRNAK